MQNWCTEQYKITHKYFVKIYAYVIFTLAFDSGLVALPPDTRLRTNRRQQAEVPALVAGHAAGQDEGVLLGVVMDERVYALDVLVRQRPLALHPPTRLLAPRSDAVLPVPLLNGTKLVPADSENRRVQEHKMYTTVI